MYDCEVTVVDKIFSMTSKYGLLGIIDADDLCNLDIHRSLKAVVGDVRSALVWLGMIHFVCIRSFFN